MTDVVVEADGGSRGNPGPAGYGAVVRAQDGTVLAERKDAIGIDTNNVAEYRGLIAGLEAARELGARSVQVRMDSKLVVEQMSGRWQVKHPSMRPLAARARALAAGFDSVRFDWVPRAENGHADRLANEAMDEAAGIRHATATEPAPEPAPEPALAQPRLTGRTDAGDPTGPTAQRPARTWLPPADRATTLYLVRHGSTVHSTQWRFSGRNDLPLDDAGRAQAAALAVAPALSAVTAVISSPILRARQTAEAIADELGLDVRVDDGLAETDFGEWEGLTFAEISERYPAQLARWLASTATAPPGGESFDAVAERVRPARDRIVETYPGQPVAVVSHVTPIKTMLRLALEAPPVTLFKLHLDTASISRVDHYADGNESVRLFNDTHHLS